MRTITLELLRHGPAHNQLISPLTPYLALCENHPAVTWQLPLEHNQLLHRLRALSYRLGEESRAFQLQDTARLLADLLATIPGLAVEMGRADAGPVHLRLVLSASELALLPFELALTPPGLAGAGQPLLLQPQQPVCITRETRRVADIALPWPQETRVLLVVASPPGVPAVPDLAHLLALRGRLAAWIGSPDQLDQHLTVITQASLQAIEAACAQHDFSHVHILAHGSEYAAGYDTRFGLMLHAAGDPDGPVDIVSGERLAGALRTPREGGSGRLSSPAVVTLASCNSGAVGSVAGAGASLAHALHQAGVPMVIASQFPLSFGGSVRLVEKLYDGLLWGDDPRSLLIELRCLLHSQFPESHDWASVTAYTSLPADFERRLGATQIQRAMTAINVALTGADTAVARLAAAAQAPRADPASTAHTPHPAHTAMTATAAAEISTAAAQVRSAKQRLTDLVARHPDQRGRVLNLLASTEKREAEFAYSRAAGLAGPGATFTPDASMWAGLARARQLYFDHYALGRSPYAAIQYLSLCAVLQHAGRDATGWEASAAVAVDQPGRAADKLWDLAEVQAQLDLQGTEPQSRVWALGNLIELYLLAPTIPGVATRGPDWPALATAHAQRLLATSANGAFELFSTRRQIKRYTDWYARLAQPDRPWDARVLAAAAQIVALLPAEVVTNWNYATG